MPEKANHNTMRRSASDPISLDEVDPKAIQSVKKALPKLRLTEAHDGVRGTIVIGTIPGELSAIRRNLEALKRLPKISGLRWMEFERNSISIGLETAVKKSGSHQGTQQMIPSYDLLRKAAIRVAAKTDNQGLRTQLLNILRQAKEDSEDEDEDNNGKEARHEKGKSVDIGDWLKEHGFADAAKKWEEHEGQIGNKSAARVVFPKVREMAWKRVVEFSHRNPQSRVASGSTASRSAAADSLAQKWIQDVIQHPLSSALLANYLKEK